MGCYVRLRDCKLTYDETVAYSILMARANGLFNGRRLFAIEILRGSKKTCEWDVKRDRYHASPLGPFNPEKACGKPVTYRLIFTYEGRKFSVYLCERHFKRFLRNTVRMVEADMRRVLESVAELNARLSPYLEALTI